MIRSEQHKSRFIWMQLMGGMGNQMFQYAFGRSMSEKYGLPLILDDRYFQRAKNRPGITPRTFGLSQFGIEAGIYSEDCRDGELREIAPNPVVYPQARALRERVLGPVHKLAKKSIPVIFERQHSFDPHIEKVAMHGGYFVGHWQSAAYFTDLKLAVRRELTIDPSQLSREAEALAERIRAEMCVCMNIRRGDFASSRRNRNFHGLLGLDYYEYSLRRVRERFGHLPVYVFSDDLEWCSANLLRHRNVQLVDHNLAGPDFSWYQYLMSQGSIFIIPNSSFAWWAVWLSSSTEKHVVAPPHWTRAVPLSKTDLLPGDWCLL